MWLIDKFEGRLYNWQHRLLSLGGRYTLIKAVLESIPVYWMAIAHIPASILKMLRQRIYSFLWTGNKKKKGYHLSNWQDIAKPKGMGGWGLKNLPLFHKASIGKHLLEIIDETGTLELCDQCKIPPPTSAPYMDQIC
jgi:hypothetical protein